jgi:hypothetical protein
MKNTLKEHMSKSHAIAMSGLATTHLNCIEKTGVARPGKTARDKARGHIPYRTNRRIWDREAREWVKVQ